MKINNIFGSPYLQLGIVEISQIEVRLKNHLNFIVINKLIYRV